jgi:metallo-beta-lactamase family protein
MSRISHPHAHKEAYNEEAVANSCDGTLPSRGNSLPASLQPPSQAPTSELVTLHGFIRNQLPHENHIVAMVKADCTIGILIEEPVEGEINATAHLQEVQLKLQEQFPQYRFDITTYPQEVAPDFTSYLHSRISGLAELKPSKETHFEYDTAIKIGSIIWSGDAKSTTANSFLIDYTLSSLTIIEERVSDSPARMNRATTKYQNMLNEVTKETSAVHGQCLSINVTTDKGMHDLRSHLRQFLKGRQISHFNLINDPQCLIVHVLHNSNDELYCEKERSEIRSFVQGITPGAVKVEGVTSGYPRIQELFSSLPENWRLSEVSISPDGRSCRLTSNVNYGRRWDEGVQTFIESLFPDGVYLNNESFVELSTHDEQYLTILHALPTRYELRSVHRCVVSGEIELFLVQAPEKSMVLEIAETLSTTIAVRTIPPLFAPYPIQDAVRFIAQYAGRIPFISVPPEYHSVVHGRGGCLSIGGSCFSIRVVGLHIVADFGARLQEGQKLELTDDIIQNSAFGVVTHLHTDHSGALLEAYLQGYRKPILMTKTIALAMYPILREQAARNNIPLDVIEELYKLVVIVPCNVPLQVSENHTLTFYLSGHSLGSTSVRVEYRSESEEFSVLYTGDYKNAQSRLYNPAIIPPPSDVVISEGTYGMREGPSVTEASEDGIESIKSAVLGGSTVICPLLSFDRAQEVLMMLDPHRGWFESHNIPIHIVGGIIEKNLIYGYVAKDQPQVLSELAHLTKPWRFSQHSSISKPGNSDYSSELLERGKGKVILVSGGMVVGHAAALVQRYQDDPSALLLLTCYQAEGTLGREILDVIEGRAESIESLPDFCMNGDRVSFAGHSYGTETLDYLTKAVKEDGTIVLVHGTEESLQEIKKACIERRIGGEVLMLKFGEDTTLRE